MVWQNSNISWHGEVVSSKRIRDVEEDAALAAHVLLIVARSSNTSCSVHWGGVSELQEDTRRRRGRRTGRTRAAHRCQVLQHKLFRPLGWSQCRTGPQRPWPA